MKSIGIITMHKIPNCGSALQAYALQHKISQLGYDARIIDYEYSGMYSLKAHGWIGKIKDLLAPYLKPERKDVLFNKFYKRYFILTKKTYNDQNIKEVSPLFDVYMTGSDQVWNTQWSYGYQNFLLSFLPDDAVRLSFSSSFATSTFDDRFRGIFSKELRKYDAITVREKSGVNIIKSLIGADVPVTCDPTILLSDAEYNEIARDSKLKIKGPFVLVYILSYMFNPYPDIVNIVEYVKSKLNMKVVFLDCNNYPANQDEDIVINNGNPIDFCWLFANASYVITTSFHGTVFSVINKKPFLAVVKSKKTNDGRIVSFLECLGLTKSLVSYEELPIEEQMDVINTTNNISINTLREESTRILTDMLTKYAK